MRLRIAIAVAGGALALSCSWVKVSERGQAIRVARAEEVAGCVAKGRAHAQTTDRVLIFARRREPVRSELESLARNEAALMGGDTVVPATGIERGRQSFDVFACAGGRSD